MSTESSKSQYAAPRLTVYGDVREITKAVSNVSANADGGTGSTNKTS